MIFDKKKIGTIISREGKNYTIKKDGVEVTCQFGNILTDPVRWFSEDMLTRYDPKSIQDKIDQLTKRNESSEDDNQKEQVREEVGLLRCFKRKINDQDVTLLPQRRKSPIAEKGHEIHCPMSARSGPPCQENSCCLESSTAIHESRHTRKRPSLKYI